MELKFDMYFSIILYLIICQFLNRVPYITALDEDNEEEICLFKDTVNLTNLHSYDNGSYIYQGILIPPEKQRFYDYDLKFMSKRRTVTKHLRGCVCEQKPCIKLCCNHDEYFDEYESKSCEKITPDMKVSWDLSIDLENGQTKMVDIFKHFTTQVGLPCLEPESFNATLDEWILKEDGTVFFPQDESGIDTLNYCYSLVDDSGQFILMPFSCSIINEPTWQMLLNTYAMSISVIFLIPTILVYLVLKELRGNLRGKLLISYLSSLTIGYSIISLINVWGIIFDSTECVVIGFTAYFFFMAAFLWLSVLCYDIWMIFRETTNNLELNSKKNQKKFLMYSLYAWLTAGFATAILVYVQFSPNIDPYYKPEINSQSCWINTFKWSAAIYFYGPNLIILLFNMITFIYLTRRIYKVRSDLARMTQKDKFFQENAIVILRLFLIMGISWLFDILSFCMRNYEKWDFLFAISDFANAIQGLLIFSLFVLKPKVLNRLRYLFQKDPYGKPRKSLSTSTTNFSKTQGFSAVPTAVTP